MTTTITPDEVRNRAREFRAANDPAHTDPLDFLRARFDAGLAWVHFPVGLGGLDALREYQAIVDEELAGTPDNDPRKLVIGLGMAGPTILQFGTEAQQRRYLRPLWTGEEVWCQLFSEPGAGSDLAGLGTRAVRDGGEWVVTGQKVWTSVAHLSSWAILVARTDPDVPKHKGLTYFICDMTAPGVEIRPLRQITGEAEFNEVFLTETRIPDANRLGEVGDGWRVAQTTLMNERFAIGGRAEPREGGMVGELARAWRSTPEGRDPVLRDQVLREWARAEAIRLAGDRSRQQLAVGAPGPEGSGVKVAYADSNQACSALEMQVRGADALRRLTWHTEDWKAERPQGMNLADGDAGYRYLRAKGNSIEGGTSEILRNVIAERILGLPREARQDTDRPWKDLPR